jgi:uncharacterized protein (UPF0332 family)
VSLETWVENGWLQRHEASAEEIGDLCLAARRDLADARKDLSPAWRFAIAYNAALRLCTAALYSAGYRATRDQKHYRTIAALPLLLGPDIRELAGFLDACRTKRHDVTYESLTALSQEEAQELIVAVGELDRRIADWLRKVRPDAIKD